MMLLLIEVLNIKCEREDKRERVLAQSVDAQHSFLYYHVLSVFRLLSPQSSNASLIASRTKCFIIIPNMQVIINHDVIQNSITPKPVVPIACSSDIIFPLVCVFLCDIIS